MAMIRYNSRVNVPAVRTVAERPSPVKRRYNVWLCAWSEIEPQVSLTTPCPANRRITLYVGRRERYNSFVNVHGIRTVAERPSPVKWRTTSACNRTSVELKHQIVNDTQEVVVLYHLFLLGACLPAWRRERRAGLVRHQAPHMPSKPFVLPPSIGSCSDLSQSRIQDDVEPLNSLVVGRVRLNETNNIHCSVSIRLPDAQSIPHIFYKPQLHCSRRSILYCDCTPDNWMLAEEKHETV